MPFYTYIYDRKRDVRVDLCMQPLQFNSHFSNSRFDNRLAVLIFQFTINSFKGPFERLLPPLCGIFELDNTNPIRQNIYCTSFLSSFFVVEFASSFVALGHFLKAL